MNIVYRIREEVEGIESNIVKLKSQLEGLNSEKLTFNEEIKKVVKAFQIQHELLTRKLSTLDDLAGADEETRAKRKLLVTKALSLLDEVDKFLKEGQERMEKQERESEIRMRRMETDSLLRKANPSYSSNSTTSTSSSSSSSSTPAPKSTESEEEKEKERERGEKELLTNPTGKGIRNDSGGLGHFGAPRGKRLHEGLDFSTTVGQDIVAPFDGKVKNMKGASKPYYPMVQMFPANPSSSFDRLEILYVKRLKEAERNVFRNVKAGDIIGAAANLQKWYSSTVGPHVHVQIFKDGVRIDPQPFFFKK